jgi:hypothetical protein
MNTGNRRRSRAQQPPPLESEPISPEDGWEPASITELDPKDDLDFDDVEKLMAEKIAAAIAELPVPKDGIDLETATQLFEKKLAAAFKSTGGPRRGPTPTADWCFNIIGIAYVFRKDNGHCAGTGTLAELCEAETGYLPNDDQIRKVFKELGAEHLLGKNVKAASAGRVSRRRSRA